MSNDLINAEQPADLAAFVLHHLKPVIEIVVPETLGRNTSPSNAAYPAIVQASALLIVGKLISESIREVGRETVKSLDEIESAVMVTV
ncbi:hypothetical protein A1351_23200 [Methylosinus sp. R-45379]|uniref:hypothetical protein n=1 Tax=Methylosinus sp. R-45379 TaxID=980563 RepID=UPI0007C8A3CB|nr:hypothetical protein [Methylosinus sp. R-45379]OAI29929.1 hypothetical protein A1351_23200 [Methylosinus sp. R-45379]